MIHQGFRDELSKIALEPATIGAIIGALGGGYGAWKGGEALRGLSESIIRKSNYVLPIGGGILGYLLANAMFKKDQPALTPQIVGAPMDPLRRLSYEGVPNVYGAPGYNPRF